MLPDFEWDDDLIQSYTISLPNPTSMASAGSGPLQLSSGSGDPNASRKHKPAPAALPKPPTDPNEARRKKDLKTSDLSWALNSMADEMYATLPRAGDDATAVYIPMLPLYMYDDDSFESLPPPDIVIANGTIEGEDGASLEGSGLYLSSGPEASESPPGPTPYHSSLGEFKRVLITSYDSKEDIFEGMWYDSAQPCKLKRCEVCFDGEDR